MPSRTVLLVDPDGDSLTIYSLILEHHGYRVLRARTPEDGLRLAIEQRPDVVVAELFLAPVEGKPLPDRLRQEAWSAGVPIVALSTLALAQTRAGLGVCDGYLLKPCVPTRLLAEVERVLQHS